jgi:hypothetical protein
MKIPLVSLGDMEEFDKRRVVVAESNGRYGCELVSRKEGAGEVLGRNFYQMRKSGEESR